MSDYAVGTCIGLPLLREKSGKFKVREKSRNSRIREIWNFVDSQGNLRKVREIKHNLYFIRGCGDQ